MLYKKLNILALSLLTIGCQSQENTFETQMEVFSSLGYKLNEGITKETIYKESEFNGFTNKETDSLIKNQPFERLYYFLGSRTALVDSHNNTDQCIWFDLEFIDPSDQYIWFMKRMGIITDGEINYSNISIQVDENSYEWIYFTVNGINKKWKLEKVGYISDSFFQRFSYLPSELEVKGRYTYYDDGGQQFVIDYATKDEQTEFIKKTGLKREWLGEGNHFSEPID